MGKDLRELKRGIISAAKTGHTEIHYHTERMAQQDNAKIQEEFLKEKKWRDIWAMNKLPKRIYKS